MKKTETVFSMSFLNIQKRHIYSLSISFILFITLLVLGPTRASAADFLTNIGGGEEDHAYDIKATSDGGFIAVGETYSYGNGLEGEPSSDMYIVKTDSSGKLDSNFGTDGTVTIGGEYDDKAFSVVELSGGGYVVVGRTGSEGFDWDMYIVKLDASGNLDTSFNSGGTMIIGGDGMDRIVKVKEASDGDILVGGVHYNTSTESSEHMFLMKMDTSGNLDINFGMSGESDRVGYLAVEEGNSELADFIETSDGGYLLVGSMGYDLAVVKLDSNGDLDTSWGYPAGEGGEQYGLYTYSIGDSTNRASSVIETSDGGYLITGRTDQGINDEDMLFIKLNSDGTPDTSWGPDAGEGSQGVLRVGGSGNEGATTKVFDTGDGYVVGGFTSSYGPSADTMRNMYLVKINTTGTGLDSSFGTNGTVVIEASYDIGEGSSRKDLFTESIDQVDGGGWVLLTTREMNPGGESVDEDFIIVTLDSSGTMSGTCADISGSGGNLNGDNINDGGSFLTTSGLVSFSSGGTVDAGGEQTYRCGLGKVTNVPEALKIYSEEGVDIAAEGVVGEVQMNIRNEQDPQGEFFMNIGGSFNDDGKAVVKSDDGGYVTVGMTRSYSSAPGDDTDIYVVKTDGAGELDTSFGVDDGGGRTGTVVLGGGSTDEAYDIIQTNDGGYVIAGTTRSYGYGSTDVYIVKLDSNGDLDTNFGNYVEGSRNGSAVIGGTGYERVYSIEQTDDGGYVAVGYTSSYGQDDSNIYVVKLDSSGNLDTSFGFDSEMGHTGTRVISGFGIDGGHSIKQTNDGGYIITGYTDSAGSGGSDVVVIKLDSSGDTFGDMSWGYHPVEGTRTGATLIGGTSDDAAYDIIETSDGGFLAVGHTESYGQGIMDGYVVKLDSMGDPDSSFGYDAGGGQNGTVVLGGTDADHFNSVLETDDGNFLIAGKTCSFGSGGCDVYLVKLLSNGTGLDTSFGNNGTVTFSGVSTHNQEDELTNFVDIKPSHQGGYVVTSSIDNPSSGGYDILNFLVDSTGNLTGTCAHETGSGGTLAAGGDFFTMNLDEDVGGQNGIKGVSTSSGGSTNFSCDFVEILGNYIAQIDGYIETDVDWSGINAESIEDKAVFHYDAPACSPDCTVSDVPGSQSSTYVLYVPIPENSLSDAVYICPGVTSLGDISESCSNGVEFRHGDTKNVDGNPVTVTKVTLADGKQYWQADGVTSTGGVSLSQGFDLKDTLTRLEVSQASDHTIEFGSVEGLTSSGDTIEIEFDPVGQNWDLSSITLADIDLEDDGTDLTLAATADATHWGLDIDTATDTLTFTHPTAADFEDIEPNSELMVKVGTVADGGSNQIINPGTVADYEVHMTNTYSASGGGVETGEVEIPIVDDDTVNVYGYIDTVMSFDIDTAVGDSNCDASGASACNSHGNTSDGAGYVVDLGEMTLEAVNKSGDSVMHADGNTGVVNYIWFDLETNASSGASVTVVSANEGLRKDGSNIIPSVTDGNEREITSGTGLYGLNHATGFANDATIGGLVVHAHCDATSGDSYYCDVADGGTPIPIFDSNYLPVDDGRVQFAVGASPDAGDGTGTYTDQLTFVATATF